MSRDIPVIRVEMDSSWSKYYSLAVFVERLYGTMFREACTGRVL